jgi:glutathione S-transferase
VWRKEDDHGTEDLWRRAFARLSHLVDGQGAGARLRACEGRFRHRRDPHTGASRAQSQWQVPVIDDNGFVLWESMAINLYLAKKYGVGTLYPTRLEDEARAWQWSFWGMTEVERPVLTAMFNRAILSEDKRDAAAADDAEKQLAQPLRVLNGALSRGANLLGDNFTVADLNVASILAWARPARIDMSPFPKVADWLKNCAERPAARAARQLQRE